MNKIEKRLAEWGYGPQDEIPQSLIKVIEKQLADERAERREAATMGWAV